MLPSIVKRVIKSKTMILHINPSQLESFDSFEAVGGKLWPVADILVKYLINNSDHLIEGKNILELGTGSGVVGISCAYLQAKNVILTDMSINQRRMEYDHEGILIENTSLSANKVILENCQKNADINKNEYLECELLVQELIWGEEYIDHINKLQKHIKTLDLIIGSDVTYHVNRTPKLFWTIAEILRRRHQSSLIKSNKISNAIISNRTISNDNINCAYRNNTTHIIENKGNSNNSNSLKNCRVILIHQDRLDISTKNTLVAAAKAGLHHTVLFSGCEDGCRYEIWEFKLQLKTV